MAMSVSVKVEIITVRSSDDIAAVRDIFMAYLSFIEGRGHNLGLRLTQAAIAYSKKDGFDKMYLDTDPGLLHANTIYEHLGFNDIERYYGNPMGCSRYMALTL